MPLYTHIAEVTCSYGFPVDMLRYDSAHPDSEQDAGRIELSLIDPPTFKEDPTPIRVRKNTTDKKARWTEDRWKSFGCKITPVETLRR